MMRLARFLGAMTFVLACSSPSDRAGVFQSLCLDRWRIVEPTSHRVVTGADGWLFFGPELRHIGLGRFWGPDAVPDSSHTDRSDPLPAILDFKTQLDTLGIELLMVPVPPKAFLYPDMLSSAVNGSTFRVSRLDPFHQEFYELLRREGIAVIDLLPGFLAARLTEPDPLYCKTDTHWSGRGCVVAAAAISAELRSRGWSAADGSRNLSHGWRTVEILGDLASALGQRESREPVSVRVVGETQGGMLEPVPPDRSSPIVLLGDSHCLVFHAGDDMHGCGAGLPDQMALELGRAVDLIAVRGSGATPARVNLMRRSRSSRDYLPGKRVIIWCFSAREFTESAGWQKVALTG